MNQLRDDEFYMEQGKFVLTEWFLWRRGYCCGNGCRHCPFEHEAVPEATKANFAPPRAFFEEGFEALRQGADEASQN